MPRPLAPLAPTLPAILTVPEGREAGLSRARLRAPDLVPVGHGLRRGGEAGGLGVAVVASSRAAASMRVRPVKPVS